MDDLISRQAAIDVAKQHWYKPDIAKALEELPSADTDISDYSDRLWKRLWKNAYERGKAEGASMPSAEPEIIRCKDCKNSEHWYRDRRRCFLWSEDGVSVFDDGFCNYAERKQDE